MSVSRSWPFWLSLALLTLPVSAATASHKKKPLPPAPAKVVPDLTLDGQGHAHWVLQSREPDPTRGKLFFAASVAQGLVGLQSWFDLPRSPKANADLYVEANNTSVQTRGHLLTTWPDGVHINADATGEATQDHDQWGLKGNLDASFPSIHAKVDSLAIDAQTALTGYRTGDMKLHTVVVGDWVKTDVLPEFRSLDVTESRADDDTTIKFSLVLPPTSSEIDTIKGLATNPDDPAKKLGEGLTKSGFTVKSVTFSNVRVTDTEAGADLTVVVALTDQDIESRVQALVGNLGLGAKTDAATINQGLEELLGMQVQNVDLHVQAHDTTLEGSVDAHVLHFDKAMMGVLDLYQVVFDVVQSSVAHKDDPHQMVEWMTRAGHINMQRARAMFVGLPADSTDVQNYAFNMLLKNGDLGDTLHVDFDCHGNLHDMLALAQAAHFPVVTAQSGHLTVHSAGANVEVGADFSLTGPWLQGAVSAYAEAARQMPKLARIADLVQAFGLDDLKYRVSWHGNHLAVTGYSQMSGFAPLLQTALAAFYPGFHGELTFLQLNMWNPDGHAVHRHDDFYLGEVPTTPHDALVDILRLPMAEGSAHPRVHTGSIAPPSQLQAQDFMPEALPAATSTP